MSKEFKIGLLAVVSSVLLYTGFNFLKGTDFFSTTNTYYAVYDRIDGLTVSNQVMVNGLAVGRVSAIVIKQNEGNKLLVSLAVRNDLKLGKKSKAVLKDNGLLGGKIIELQIGKIDTPLKHGETLIAVRDEGLMAEITAKADPIVAKADSIMSQVNGLLTTLSESKEDISKSMSNISGITGSLKNSLDQGQVDQILRNIKQLSASLVSMQKEFQPIVGKMGTFTDKLNQMELDKAVQQANNALSNLNQVMEKVNKGEGTLGALANNDSLYNNLNNVSNSVDKLFIDLRENPKRYINISVFGKKEKEKK